MTSAVLLAACAAAVAVPAGWEVLGALQEGQVARRARRVLAPLRLAGAAGHEPTAGERRRLVALGSGALLAGGWLVSGPVAGALLAALAPVAVSQVVRARRARWRRALAAGAPAAARALADALSGGHAVRGAIGQAATGGSVPGPAGQELRRATRRLALGGRTQDVLEDLRSRADDPAWDALVAAVLLQREAGGDLAGLLRRLAGTQEEARRVEADARSLTAQARFTAHLVAGLPLLAVVLAELTSPGYVASLIASPLALMLLAASGVLQAIALAAVARLGRVAGA